MVISIGEIISTITVFLVFISLLIKFLVGNNKLTVRIAEIDQVNNQQQLEIVDLKREVNDNSKSILKMKDELYRVFDTLKDSNSRGHQEINRIIMETREDLREVLDSKNETLKNELKKDLIEMKRDLIESINKINKD